MTCKNGGICDLHEYVMKERERDREHIAELYSFYDKLKDRLDKRLVACKGDLHKEITTEIRAAVLGNRLWMISWVTGLSVTVSTLLSFLIRYIIPMTS